MKKILLRWRFGKGKWGPLKAATVIVDEQDAYLLRSYPFRVDRNVVLTTETTATGRHRVHLSRLIMGAKSGEAVIHLNMDPLDCRRENLRVVLVAEQIKWTGTYKRPAGTCRGRVPA